MVAHERGSGGTLERHERLERRHALCDEAAPNNINGVAWASGAHPRRKVIHSFARVCIRSWRMRRWRRASRCSSWTQEPCWRSRDVRPQSPPCTASSAPPTRSHTRLPSASVSYRHTWSQVYHTPRPAKWSSSAKARGVNKKAARHANVEGADSRCERASSNEDAGSNEAGDEMAAMTMWIRGVPGAFWRGRSLGPAR